MIYVDYYENVQILSNSIRTANNDNNYWPSARSGECRRLLLKAKIINKKRDYPVGFCRTRTGV